MRTLHGAVAAVIAGLGVAGACGALAVGCGGDDTALPSYEAGPDVTTDTRPDVQVVEAGDSGAGDAADANDTGTISFDSGDATPPGLVFSNQEVNALCTAFIGCCPPLDAGSYSQAQCVASASGYAAMT